MLPVDCSAVRAVLLQHVQQYPKLTPQDAVKLLYQSEFGSGHMITDTARSYDYLLQELACTPNADAPLTVESIGGGMCRLYLAGSVTNGLNPKTVHRLFLRAARPRGSQAYFAQKRRILREMCAEGVLPFSLEALSDYLQKYEAAGCPSVHHSDEYRAAYAPAYRLICAEDAVYLPLLAAIDLKIAQQERVCVAVDGRCGSGKSRFAALAAEIYDCTVLHMDDFFLPFVRKTPQRLAEPGGNVDYERFAEEVLPALRSGQPILYRAFDCGAQALREPVLLSNNRVVLTEGSYALHPKLADAYDLRVFLTVNENEQLRRLAARDGEALLQRFIHEWIPLEERYFAAVGLPDSADLVLDMSTPIELSYKN